jgi:hypothetical protein
MNVMIMPGLELPDTVLGWLSLVTVIVVTLRWGINKIRNWGQDTKTWNEAAKALTQLSKDVGELLYEFRGGIGRPGIMQRLTEIETEIIEIKETRNEERLFVEMYKAELIERRATGQQTRRGADDVLTKLSPDL